MDLLVSIALGPPFGVDFLAAGQVAERRDETRELLQHARGDRFPERSLRYPFEDGGILARIQREPMLVVVRAERPRCGVVGELELAAFEKRPVVVAQHRHQHLALERRAHRIPVDVEEPGVVGRRAVLQHIEPPDVVGAHHAHVVRHHVQDLAHAVRLERVDERFEVLAASDLRVERVVVDDVVAVLAARARLEVRRAVDVADAQAGEVGHELCRLVEAEIAVELQAIGCAWNDRAHTLPRAPLAAAARRARPRACARASVSAVKRGSSGQSSSESVSFRHQFGCWSVVPGEVDLVDGAEHVLELHGQHLRR